MYIYPPTSSRVERAEACHDQHQPRQHQHRAPAPGPPAPAPPPTPQPPPPTSDNRPEGHTCPNERQGPLAEEMTWLMDNIEGDPDLVPDAENLNDDELLDRVKSIHEDGGDTESVGWGSKWSKETAQQALLRTHTTVGTIRYLSNNPKPPVRVFSVGRVFRREALDATHLPEFTQVEGIIVEPNANSKSAELVKVPVPPLVAYPNASFPPDQTLTNVGD